MQEDITSCVRVIVIFLSVLLIFFAGLVVGSEVYLQKFCDKQEQTLTIVDKYMVESYTTMVSTGKSVVPIRHDPEYRVIVTYGGKLYSLDVTKDIFDNHVIGSDIDCISYHSKQTGECITVRYNLEE